MDGREDNQMSSAIDMWGNDSIPPDDPDGTAAEEREAELLAQLASLADVCLTDSGPVNSSGATIWTCDNCGAEGTEDVMDQHTCPDAAGE